MPKVHPTTSAKPAKPSIAFPLFAHGNGQWAKKIRGRLHYFGLWADPDAALKEYLDQKDDLHAGRTPRTDPAGTTVKDLANAFLRAKDALVQSGELSPRTRSEYQVATDSMVAVLGKRRLVSDLVSADFAKLRNKMAAKWGPYRLAKMIQYVRSVCKHGFEEGLLGRPIRFGPGFTRPTKKTLRLHRAEQGPKLFSAEQLRSMIDASGPPLKAMLLLAINAAFGNSDCGNLPLAALDLDRGWANYPRPKTGVARRCPLWPETVASIHEALADRPEPKDQDDAGLLFITKYGQSWAKYTSTNPITQETGKLLRALGIKGRNGLNFYTIRHVFRTVADEARDQPAADFIMGHEVAHMSSVYRETISDARLLAVADHVRAWLFGKAGGVE